MSNFETISYKNENRVATITLNRPKTMNAISQTMRKELKQVIDTVEANDDTRIVVIRAEGRGFSSGTDLTEGLTGFDSIDEQIQQEYKPVLMGIAQSKKPYIASINGACAGIGAALAMTCDLAVMSDDSFLYLAFAGLSLVPDGGMAHYLVSAMGYKKAYQTFVEAGRIKADECLHYGLVNKVVEASKLDEETQAWAQTLAEGAPLAQMFGKQIMRAVPTSSVEEIIDLEAKFQVNCSTSKDFKNATMAFFKKQKPTFIGE
jgi:2-(1,2-epoxy-1,2-dihydrophenyl)acetyl-CoA isomerase